MPWGRWSILLPLIVVAASVLPSDCGARAKTDIIVLKNGDHLTGEIKQLDLGILTLGTDGIGTISIEWDDVDSLSSVYRFRVEDQAGAKHFGAIGLRRDGTVWIGQEGRVERTTRDNVVVITPLEASFWQQVDGSISLGFSFTKANKLAQLSSNFNLRYRTSIRLVELNASSIATSQESAPSSQRRDLTLGYSRLFNGPMFATASATAQTNDELGLDLRLMLAPGLGAALIRTNHNRLVTVAGLSVNREWAGGGERKDNLEGFVLAQHSVFRYDYPKTDIRSKDTFFPSLTSGERYRNELDISASREVVKDFVVFLSFYDSYDSNPPDPTASKNDYGLVINVGWTF